MLQSMLRSSNFIGMSIDLTQRLVSHTVIDLFNYLVSHRFFDNLFAHFPVKS